MNGDIRGILSSVRTSLESGYAVSATDYSVTSLLWGYFVPTNKGALARKIRQDIRALPIGINDLDTLFDLVKLVEILETDDQQQQNESLKNLVKRKIKAFTGTLELNNLSNEDESLIFNFIDKLVKIKDCPCKTEVFQALNPKYVAQNPLMDIPNAGSSFVPARTIPECMLRAMVLFHNYNPELSSDKASPKMSFLFSYWHNYFYGNQGVGSNAQFTLSCLEYLEHPERFTQERSFNFRNLKASFRYQLSKGSNEPLLLPFSFIRDGAVYTSLAEVCQHQEGFIFKDVVHKDNIVAFEEKSFDEQFAKLMERNYKCWTQDHVQDKDGDPQRLLPVVRSFHKPMRVFFANAQGENARDRIKVDHKLAAIKEVLTAVPKWAEDSVLRQWVKGSLANLDKSLTKALQRAPKDIDLQNHLRFCRQILEKINSAEANSQLRIVPEYCDLNGNSTLDLTFDIAEPLPPPLKLQETTPLASGKESYKIQFPEEMPSFEATTREEYFAQAKILQKWVTCAQKAFDSRDFDALKEISSQFLSSLQSPEQATQFFENLESSFRNDVELNRQFLRLFQCSLFESRDLTPPTSTSGYSFRINKPTDCWSLPLYRMNYFLIHTQVLDLKISPDHFVPMLKGLALQLRLADISTTAHHHSSSPVHTYHLPVVLQGLQSYAADMGEHGGEILEILKQLRKPHQINNERSSPSYDMEPVYGCNDQVAVHTAYELACFVDLLCNTITLSNDSQASKGQEKYRQENNQALTSYHSQVDKLRKGERMHLGHSYQTGYNDYAFYVFPFEGVYHRDFNATSNSFINENAGTAISSFKHLSLPIQNPKIRNFIQQGQVATRNRLAKTGLGCDMENIRFLQHPEAAEDVEDVRSFDPNTFLGENKTQKVIHQEKEWLPGVSTQCFQELQLMQTSSLSRAANTLSTFAIYPDLLAHLDYGQDFRTVFSLNLFRDASLYREFVHHPDRIYSHFQTIDKLMEYHRQENNYEAVLFLIDTRRKMLGLLQSTRKYQPWDKELIIVLQNDQDGCLKTIMTWWDLIQNHKADTDLAEHKYTLSNLILDSMARIGEKWSSRDALTLLARLGVTYALNKKGTPHQVERINNYLALHQPLILKLVNEIGPGPLLTLIISNEDRVWTKVNEISWSLGNWIFNVETLQISFQGELKSKLPIDVRNNEFLNILDTKGVLSNEYTLSPVELNGQLAWSFEFIGRREFTYRVIHSPKKQNDLKIYRSKDDQGWALLVNFHAEHAPEGLRKALCWKNCTDQSFLLEDYQGKEIFRYKKNKLLRIEANRDEVEMLPLRNLGHRHEMFTKFAGESHLELLQTQQGIIASYPSFNNCYLWNNKHNVWEAEFSKGYYLSGASLSGIAKTSSLEQGKEPLFAPTFEGYHLLQKNHDPHAPKKLLLAPVQYERRLPSLVPTDLAKYQWSAHPIPSCAKWQNPSNPCIFEIDSEGHLSGQKSTDYLYLAYVLFTQRRYSDALHYLRFGQMAADYDPGLYETLRDWVHAWNDSSAEAVTFKLRVCLCEQKIRMWLTEDMETTIKNDAALPQLMQAYSSYLAIQRNVPAHIALTSEDRELIKILEPRALPRDRSGTINEPKWALHHEATKNLIGQKKVAETVIEEVLENQLKLQQQLDVERQKQAPPTIEPSIAADLDSIHLENYLLPQNEIPQSVNDVLNECRELFQGESLADDVGRNLVTDIEFYAANERFAFKPDANLDELKTQCQKFAKKWKGKEDLIERQLIALFHLPQLDVSQKRQEMLKNSLTTYSEAITQTRICYLNNDYQTLIDKGLINLEDVPHLDSLMDQYLENRVTRKSWQRKADALDQFQSGKLHVDRCIEILRSQQNYDGENFSLKRLFKVVEDAMNISVRKMQLDSLTKEISKDNAFKHAGTGFGKTTLQRHLLLRLKSLRNLVGGQLTHSELFETHHQKLAMFQRAAFDTAAFPFTFARKEALTPYLLKQIQLRTLRAKQEKACLDHTKGDILSFKNRFATAFLDHADFALFKEFQSARQLYKNNLSINSDELITVTSPLHDHNFSYGNAEHLDEVLYDTCMDLFDIVKTDQFLEFFTRLTSNHLKYYTEAEFSAILDEIAKCVAEKEGYKKDSEEGKPIVSYLRQHYLQSPEKEYRSAQEFYLHHIANKKPRLECLHRYFEIFKDFPTKLRGVHFGRSNDGLTVKPFRKSAKCLESSQRSDVTTTIFETCFDYTVKGASEEHVNAFISAKRNLAKEEAKEMKCKPEKTNIAITFEENYKIPLFSSRIHIPDLLIRINANDFLRTVYFREFSYYPCKIEGTSSHLSNQYLHFSGSSASAERVDALPLGIQRDSELSRQKGDVGEKFFHLIAGFNEQEHFIPINPMQPIEQQIGPHLNGGDVFIDVVPFFPGESAQEIATKVRGHTNQLQQNIRFVDESGKLRSLNSTEINSSTTGILTQLHVEGTDWQFLDGLMSHSKDTPFTEFYQAIRMRELGKGQKAKIASDINWSEVEARYPQLKEKQILSKLFFMLAINESETIKKHVYTRVIKDIRAIAYNGVDNMLSTVQDEESLKKLRAIPEIHSILAPTNPLSIQALGALRSVEKPRKKLADLAADQKKFLVEICQKADNLKCDLTPIKEALQQLENIDELLPSDEKLPTLVTTFSIDGIEDLEVTNDVDQTNDQIVSQDIDLQVDIAVNRDITQEQEEIFYKRKVSDEGQEEVCSPLEDAIHALLEEMPAANRTAFPIAQAKHPLYISAHALGYPNGNAVNKMEINVEDCFWMGIKNETPVMAPTIAFVQKGDKKVGCLMSVKDADLFLQKHSLHHNSLQPGESYGIGFIEKRTYGMGNTISVTTREFEPTHWAEEAEFSIHDWDLRQEGFPEWATEQDKETIVYAKLLYVNCPFSQEELMIAKTLLNGMEEATSLKKKLNAYLKANYPDSVKSHPVLSILT